MASAGNGLAAGKLIFTDLTKEAGASCPGLFLAETFPGGFRQINPPVTLFRHKTPANSMEVNSDHDTWKRWFHEHGPKLLLCARQWTRSLADAEDVVQEAFVRFWRHQRHLGGEPTALLLTSVRRAACDLARRETRRATREQRAEGGLEDNDPLFAPSPDGDDRCVAIEAALQRLPAEQREVLALKIWGELTFEQIATQLGIPANTAASRYRYALAALRQELTSTCHA
jgi:RNA polymerase sigma-70 factor, ECF subfamily